MTDDLPDPARHGHRPHRPVSRSDALFWALAQFGRRAMVFILAQLTWLTIVGVAVGAPALAAGVLKAEDVPFARAQLGDLFAPSEPSWSDTALVYLAYFLVSSAMWASQSTAYLDVADGKVVTFGSFFRPRNVTAYLATAFVVDALVAVIAALPMSPWALVTAMAVAATLTWFAPYFAVDLRFGVVGAIGASAGLFVHKGSSLRNIMAVLAMLFMGLVILVSCVFVGVLTAGYGLLVTIPVGWSVFGLLETYYYRSLSGRTPTPVPYR